MTAKINTVFHQRITSSPSYPSDDFGHLGITMSQKRKLLVAGGATYKFSSLRGKPGVFHSLFYPNCNRNITVNEGINEPAFWLGLLTIITRSPWLRSHNAITAYFDGAESIYKYLSGAYKCWVLDARDTEASNWMELMVGQKR